MSSKINKDFKIAVLGRICNEFNLGFFDHLTAINKGFSSNSYELTTNKAKYFIKVYPIDKLKSVISTAEIELFFERNGIPVLRRISSGGGNNYLISGRTVFVVFPYIYIPKIKEWRRGLYCELGNFLGKMHQYSIKANNKNISETFNLEKIRQSSLKRLRSLLDILYGGKYTDKNYRLVISNLVKKISYLENIFGDKFVLDNKAIIHGDFHPGNLCVKDSKIKFIYDFDNHCYHSVYYELAKVILHTCFSGSFDNKKFIRTKCFLVNYKKRVMVKPNVLKTAIKICIFEIFSSWRFEKKLLTEVTNELVENIKKENRAINYFADRTNLDNFMERLCRF